MACVWGRQGGQAVVTVTVGLRMVALTRLRKQAREGLPLVEAVLEAS